MQEHYEFLIGTALGVLGIAVGVLVALWQRRPEVLDYEVVTNTPLLSPHATDAVRKQVTVRSLGVDLTDPRLVTIRVTNTGKRGVASTDYVDPITVSCSSGSVFNVFVSSESRPGLVQDGDLTEGDRKDDVIAIVEPKLLHAADWFEVAMVVDGDPGSITVQADWPDRDRPMRDKTFLPISASPPYFWLALIESSLFAACGLILVSAWKRAEPALPPSVPFLLSMTILTFASLPVYIRVLYSLGQRKPRLQ